MYESVTDVDNDHSETLSPEILQHALRAGLYPRWWAVSSGDLGSLDSLQASFANMVEQVRSAGSILWGSAAAIEHDVQEMGRSLFNLGTEARTLLALWDEAHRAVMTDETVERAAQRTHYPSDDIKATRDRARSALLELLPPHVAAPVMEALSGALAGDLHQVDRGVAQLWGARCVPAGDITKASPAAGPSVAGNTEAATRPDSETQEAINRALCVTEQLTVMSDFLAHVSEEVADESTLSSYGFTMKDRAEELDRLLRTLDTRLTEPASSKAA